MIYAMKLKISVSGNEQTYEMGKNNVGLIHINEERGIIKIEFDEDSEWDCKIIPIQKVESIDYEEEAIDMNYLVDVSEY